MECQIELNEKDCTCTNTKCPRHGKCCACITHHRVRGQVPGCLFPPEVERTWDRSIACFVAAYGKK